MTGKPLLLPDSSGFSLLLTLFAKLIGGRGLAWIPHLLRQKITPRNVFHSAECHGKAMTFSFAMVCAASKLAYQSRLSFLLIEFFPLINVCRQLKLAFSGNETGRRRINSWFAQTHSLCCNHLTIILQCKFSYLPWFESEKCHIDKLWI